MMVCLYENVIVTIGGDRFEINDGGILHGIRRLEIFPLRIGGHSLLGTMICIKSPSISYLKCNEYHRMVMVHHRVKCIIIYNNYIQYNYIWQPLPY